MNENQNSYGWNWNNSNNFQGKPKQNNTQKFGTRKVSTAGSFGQRGLSNKAQNTIQPNAQSRFVQGKGFQKKKMYMTASDDTVAVVKSESTKPVPFSGDIRAQGRKTTTPGGTILKSFFAMRPHPFDGQNLFIEDVDDGDHKNPLANTAYINDIMKYFRKTELKDAPNPDFMKLQPYITANMRKILHNWLVKVHDRFDLRPETLHLAISLLDRFVSTTKVGRTKYQLVGLTSLFLASKFEQIYPPDLKKFLFMANDEYTKDQIIKMEILLLNRVDFHVQTPTTLTFLTRYAKVCQLDQEQTLFALYLSELSLLDLKFLKCLPSTIAAAAAWLAMKILPFDDMDPEEELWSATLAHHTMHTEETIRACCVELANLHRDVSAQVFSFPRWTNKSSSERGEETPAIFKKYTRCRYKRVSLLAFPNSMGGMTSNTLNPNNLPANRIVVTDRYGNQISTRPPVLLNVERHFVPKWIKDADAIESKREANKTTEIEYDPRGGSRYYDCDMMNDWDAVYQYSS